jgi:CheY-like chemotaxis protein
MGFAPYLSPGFIRLLFVVATTYSLLLAEDSEDDFHLIKMVFELFDLPFMISHVVDGRQAWEYLCGEGSYTDRTRFPFPRLLLTDLKMPGWDGFELIKRVRAQRKFDPLPVVLMSGSNQQQDRVRALELGANAYFLKDLLLYPLPDIATAFIQLVDSQCPPLGPPASRRRVSSASFLQDSPAGRQRSQGCDSFAGPK